MRFRRVVVSVVGGAPAGRGGGEEEEKGNEKTKQKERFTVSRRKKRERALAPRRDRRFCQNFIRAAAFSTDKCHPLPASTSRTRTIARPRASSGENKSSIERKRRQHRFVLFSTATNHHDRKVVAGDSLLLAGSDETPLSLRLVSSLSALASIPIELQLPSLLRARSAAGKKYKRKAKRMPKTALSKPRSISRSQAKKNCSSKEARGELRQSFVCSSSPHALGFLVSSATSSTAYRCGVRLQRRRRCASQRRARG